MQRKIPVFLSCNLHGCHNKLLPILSSNLGHVIWKLRANRYGGIILGMRYITFFYMKPKASADSVLKSCVFRSIHTHSISLWSPFHTEGVEDLCCASDLETSYFFMAKFNGERSDLYKQNAQEMGWGIIQLWQWSSAGWLRLRPGWRADFTPLC